MGAIFSNAKSILISAGILLVMLIVLSAVLHFAEKLPSPLGNAASWAADHATPDGWNG